MSGQHWIDALFRKRMKHRDFPVETGEFEEMRALLEQRNATTGAVGGAGFSKWWLSILIPMAGLLWWTIGERSDEADEHISSTTENQANSELVGIEQHSQALDNAVAHLEAGTLHSEDGDELDDQKRTGPNLGARTATVNDPATRSWGTLQAAHGSGTSRPDGVLRTPGPGSMDPNAENEDGTLRNDRGGEREDPERMNAPAEHADRSLRNGPGGERQDQGSMNAKADDRDGTSLVGSGMWPDQASMDLRGDEQAEPHGVAVPSLPDQAEVNSVADHQDNLPASEELQLFSTRSIADDAKLMEPRWSIPVVTGAPEPIRCDVQVFKRIPTGELHLYGGPLLVRTRSSAGGRSGAEPGSIIGLEYRLRSGRISWATGVRYGSYTLKADEGATDVTLSFVEVPLLATVQQGWGRFGASVQGGPSVDLLFNASGRYPLGDRSVTVFPESAFRTVNFSWSLRPQAIYRVNEHLSVSAGPLWKAQIGEVAKEGPLDGAKISSTGLTIGITWRLERSTF